MRAVKKVEVPTEIIQEAKNIADGVYFPLKGFLHQHELEAVLETMRLPGGEIWPMPIILDVDGRVAREAAKEKEVLLTDGKNEAVISDVSVYRYNKKVLAKNLFGTDDIEHPGVARVMKMEEFLVGGTVKFVRKEKHELYLTPAELKELFKKYGWANVVAFQTRNPPHRSHEHLQKIALKNVDGVFINPVIGPKKSGDFCDQHIIGAYEILVKHYYPQNSAHLGTFHTYMRYAGPKEAVFHALVRRNFGCTHMIVGRDHAGVGSYYGTYEAQKIFDSFDEKELGISIFRFPNAAFCKSCSDVRMDNECSHEPADKIHLSGTELRERLLKGEPVPDEFIRKEVIEYLLKQNDGLFVK